MRVNPKSSHHKGNFFPSFFLLYLSEKWMLTKYFVNKFTIYVNQTIIGIWHICLELTQCVCQFSNWKKMLNTLNIY